MWSTRACPCTGAHPGGPPWRSWWVMGDIFAHLCACDLDQLGSKKKHKYTKNSQRRHVILIFRFIFLFWVTTRAGFCIYCSENVLFSLHLKCSVLVTVSLIPVFRKPSLLWLVSSHMPDPAPLTWCDVRVTELRVTVAECFRSSVFRGREELLFVQTLSSLAFNRK